MVFKGNVKKLNIYKTSLHEFLDYSDGQGPIRIRNLEDLIHQLEQSSKQISQRGSEVSKESTIFG